MFNASYGKVLTSIAWSDSPADCSRYIIDAIVLFSTLGLVENLFNLYWYALISA